MNGFVVAIFTSLLSPEPAGWLAEQDGRLCVVPDRQLAKLFGDKESAWHAADGYRYTHSDEIRNFFVEPK